MNRAWVVGMLVVLVGQASAQEQVLSTVTVTAEADALEERRQAVTQKVILNPADIANLGATTVSEVISKLPGIDAGSQDAHGGQSMRARGMVRDSVQVLIDGERVGGNSRMAAASVGRLPSGELERVEILRGSSAEFGGGASVTVNLVMKKTAKKTDTTIKLATGARDGRGFAQSTVTRRGNAGNFSWVLPLTINHHVMVSSSDTDRQNFTGGARTAWTQDENAGRFKMNEIVFSPRLNWRKGGDSLSIWPTLFRGDTRRWGEMERYSYADPLAGTGLAADGSRDDRETGKTRLLRLRVEGERKLQEGKLSARLAWMKGRRDTDTRRDYLSAGGVLTTTRDRNERDDDEANAMFRFDRAWGKHLVSLALEGAVLDRDDSQNLSGVRSLYQTGERQAIAWVQDEFAINPRTTMTLGLRGERFRLDVDGDSRSHGIVAPSLAVRWEPLERWVLRSSIGSGLKLPKLDELSNRPVLSLSVNSPLEADQRGNPDLQPERSTNLEVVLEHYLPADAGVLGFNLYARKTRDFVERRAALEGPRWVERPYNEGDAEHWGAELDAKINLAKLGLPAGTVKAHLTVPRSRVHDERLDLVRDARESPRYQLSFGYERPFSQRFTAGIDVQHFAEVKTSIPGERQERTEDRTVLDLFAVYRLQPGLNLRFNANNLLRTDTCKLARAQNGGNDWQLETCNGAVASYMLTLEGSW
jgi:outer membrane receptor for ferrienterochelin and colicins